MTTSSGVEMTEQQRAALLRAEIVESVMDSIAPSRPTARP